MCLYELSFYECLDLAISERRRGFLGRCLFGFFVVSEVWLYNNYRMLFGCSLVIVGDGLPGNLLYPYWGMCLDTNEYRIVGYPDEISPGVVRSTHLRGHPPSVEDPTGPVAKEMN